MFVLSVLLIIPCFIIAFFAFFMMIKLIRAIPSAEELKALNDHKKKRLGAFKTLAQLQQLSGAEFEDWVEHLFKRWGFDTSLTQRSADKGIDLYVEKNGRKAIVQCKRYIGSVGIHTVRDFYGALIDSGVDEGYIVTTGTFTLPAKEWAQGKPINLIDGAELIKLIIKFKEQKSEGEKID